MEYAAHITETGNIQTVNEHNDSAAALAREYGEKINIGAIAELAGQIHDTGKLCGIFNSYIRGENKLKRGEIDHCYAGAKYICETAEECGELRETAEFIARTVISHHGLHDWFDENSKDYFTYRISKNENYEEIKKNLSEYSDKEKIKNMLNAAFAEYEEIKNKITELAGGRNKNFMFYMGLFERTLESVLIDADRTDTASFMSGTALYGENGGDTPWDDMEKRLNEILDGFGDKQDLISKTRRSISARCFEYAEKKVGICRLVVPTGGGKTLSSMRFAIRYCNLHKKEKIFYIAPFMSILEQNSEIIGGIAGEKNFLEHYSDILSEMETAEELADYELMTDKWDKPVTATTMVQFLNTLFSDKTKSVRRMHGLCNSVIIVDEVQSIPLKCVYLFNLAMNYLSKICGCTIVLCSATQPRFENLKYPMLIDSAPSMTGDFKPDFDIFKRTEIIPEFKPKGYTYKDAAEFCFAKYKENGSILLVVNTKNAAARIYAETAELAKSGDDNPEIVHLSTNMCPQHRKEKIYRLKELLKNNMPVICVTTRLIEAGVDISFGCAVRSLAGMDNAAQTAGRCNRNGEKGRICPVYLINISEENLSRLPEIRSSQNISEMISIDKKYSDYQSDDAMNTYFNNFYRENENILTYNIKNENKSLFEMLSKNRGWCPKKYRNRLGVQAFKSAGRNFSVIENEQTDVIVPYNADAEELAKRLEKEKNPHENMLIQRRLQKYTIGMYRGKIAELIEKHALIPLECGAYILEKRFYNEEYGVEFEDVKNELLLF